MLKTTLVNYMFCCSWCVYTCR